MTPDPKNLRIQRLTNDHIHNQVNTFLGKHVGRRIQYPVDIELIAEDLGCDILTIPDMERRFGQIAWLSSDGKALAVDERFEYGAFGISTLKSFNLLLCLFITNIFIINSICQMHYICCYKPAFLTFLRLF